MHICQVKGRVHVIELVAMTSAFEAPMLSFWETEYAMWTARYMQGTRPQQIFEVEGTLSFILAGYHDVKVRGSRC